MTQTNSLSPRESDVAELLLQGKSNKQIAAALGIADSTVEFHLTNVYAKLQVGSRTEAILKLGKSMGTPETVEPGESRVAEISQSAENDGKPISPRRLPMKRMFTIVIGVLLFAILLAGPMLSRLRASPTAVEIVAPTLQRKKPTVTLTAPPVASPKESILAQIRQLVDEYEQNVQSEKKNGKVKFEKDSLTGEELFTFQDESYQKVQTWKESLDKSMSPLLALYDQIYRDETRPTPFPTLASAEENKAYYDKLGITASYCGTLSRPGDIVLDVSIYDPYTSKYTVSTLGDRFARCRIFDAMREDFRVAPILAKVNKDADMMTIRQVTGKRDSKLTFQYITILGNAPWQNAALYADEAGTNYYVDVDTARLAQIEPNPSSHPGIPASEAKSIDELRGIATQFALTNSPRLAELKSVLTYEEGGKGSIHFFDWRYTSQDWGGTDFAMMPPMLQVGVLSNGEIVTYINTLDLIK